MNAAHKIEFMDRTEMSLDSHIINEDLAAEDFRHDITRLMIIQGWSKTELAKGYGIDIKGVEYDRHAVTHAINGRRTYRALALELFEWMKTHQGPRFNKMAQLKGEGSNEN